MSMSAGNYSEYQGHPGDAESPAQPKQDADHSEGPTAQGQPGSNLLDLNQVRWYVEHRDWCLAVQSGRYGRERLGVVPAR